MKKAGIILLVILSVLTPLILSQIQDEKQIISITCNNIQEPVYNFKVQDYENYYSENILTHNKGPKKFDLTDPKQVQERIQRAWDEFVGLVRHNNQPIDIDENPDLLLENIKKRFGLDKSKTSEGEWLDGFHRVKTSKPVELDFEETIEIMKAWDSQGQVDIVKYYLMRRALEGVEMEYFISEGTLYFPEDLVFRKNNGEIVDLNNPELDELTKKYLKKIKAAFALGVIEEVFHALEHSAFGSKGINLISQISPKYDKWMQTQNLGNEISKEFFEGENPLINQMNPNEVFNSYYYFYSVARYGSDPPSTIPELDKFIEEGEKLSKKQIQEQFKKFLTEVKTNPTYYQNLLQEIKSEIHEADWMFFILETSPGNQESINRGFIMAHPGSRILSKIYYNQEIVPRIDPDGTKGYKLD